MRAAADRNSRPGAAFHTKNQQQSSNKTYRKVQKYRNLPENRMKSQSPAGLQHGD